MLLLKEFSLQVCKIICFFCTMKISIYVTHMQTDSCSSALAWGWLDTNPGRVKGHPQPLLSVGCTVSGSVNIIL